MLGLACLGILIVLSAAGPLLVPYGTHELNLLHRFQPPSPQHWFGTDELGMDTFARVMYGGRISLTIGFIVAISSTVLGTLIGAVSGTVGGAVDNVLMRIVDVVNTIPRIVLLLVLTKVVGPGLLTIILILVALEWTTTARLARGTILSLREQAFVDAARSLGASPPRLLFRHLLPNSLAPVIVSATLDAGAAIRAETTLSFLGLGVQPPTPSWGNLLTNSSQYFFSAPWQVFFPGAFIFVALISFNLVGDGLRDALDPRQSERR
jgi:peptide/nickel transport system permease protein